MQKLVQYSTKPFDEKEVKEKNPNPNPFNKAISVTLLFLLILSSFISKGGGGGGRGGTTVVLGVGVSTAITTMGTKMKGICKGIKFISQIFVVKDHEMEIGYPTDVKHVAHIGWDSQSSTAPSWMNEFKTTSEFSSTALNHAGGPSWSSQDFEQSMGRQQASEIFNDNSQPSDAPKVPKNKKKLKKIKSAFSPKSTTSRSSKQMKSRSSFANNDMETTPSLHRVMS